LLRQAEILARKWKIPVHTQIRVYDLAQAILETINERNIDLMGWKGKPSHPVGFFGSVVDTWFGRQLRCRAGEIRSPTPSLLPFNRWLVPMAGGPNSKAAIQLLPALVTLGMPHPSVFARTI